MSDATGWSSLLHPPYPRELLAELHAGALDEELAASLWPRVRLDPDATRVLTALDATVDQLGTVALPAVPIPAHVAQRIDASLADLTGQPPPVRDLAAARARRSRRGVYVGAGLLAAAAVAGAVSLSAVLGAHSVPGTPQAAAPTAPPVLELGSGAPGPQVLAVLGRQDRGPLSEDAVLAGCLQANGIPPTTPVLGSSEVRLNGRQGILLLLPSGRAAVFTALVVGPQCSAQDAATQSKVEIGPR